MPRLKPGAQVAPQILPDQAPMAEVVVAPQSLTVTVALPQLDPRDADVVLTRHSIRLRSKRDPGGLQFVIPLPAAVEPERYVLRYRNGLYDFLVARASG